MFEAQVLDTGDTVFSPWFPRQGDSAIFTLDVVDIDGGAAANPTTAPRPRTSRGRPSAAPRRPGRAIP